MGVAILVAWGIFSLLVVPVYVATRTEWRRRPTWLRWTGAFLFGWLVVYSIGRLFLEAFGLPM